MSAKKNACASPSPAARPRLTLLGDLVYRDLRGSESKPEYKALNACLAWRWAHTRS